MSKLSIEHIQKYTCNHFDVSMDELIGRSRKQEIVKVRQVGIFFAKKYTDETLTTIGLRFGGRDHSTVISSISKVKDRIETDPEFALAIEQLDEKILHKKERAIRKLEQQAKKEAVRVHGSLTHNPFGTNIAELPEPLYCFTEEELQKYKQEIKKL